MFKRNAPDLEEEAVQYRPGQRVELKQRPGVVDFIVDYDEMMVPPISLANDPKPRYPEELTLLPTEVAGSERLAFAPRRQARLSKTKALLLK